MNLRAIRRYRLRYLLYFQTLVFSLGIVDFLYIHSGPETQFSTSILAPLLAAQASLFAIVLSLTGVGIQIIAPEYSPRLNWIFTENPRFYSAFGIVTLSLSTVVLSILLKTLVSHRQQALLTAAAVVGAGASLYELYQFVRGGFLLTAPDGVIEEHRSRLRPFFYVSHISNKNTNHEGKYHPLRGLAELIERAYQKDSLDRETARIGIDAYTDIVESVSNWFYNQRRRWMHPRQFPKFEAGMWDRISINDFRSSFGLVNSTQARGILDDSGNSRYRRERTPLAENKQLLERPVTHDLPRLAVKASMKTDSNQWANDSELDHRRGSDCLETLEHVHQQAAKAGDYSTAANVNEGFRSIIDQSISNGIPRIAGDAWKKGLDTLPALTSSSDCEPALAAREIEQSCQQMENVHRFGDGVDSSVDIPEKLQNKIYVFKYIEMIDGMCATPIIEDLDGRTRVETIRREQSEYPRGVINSPNSETLELATNLLDGLCRSVELAWHFQHEDGSRLKGREIRSTLTEVCQTVLNTPHSPLIQPIVQLYVEAAFVLSNSNQPRREWLKSLNKLAKVNQTEISDTIEYLQRTSADDYPGNLQSILTVPDTQLSLQSDDFSEHLEVFIKEVNDRTEDEFGEMERN